MGNADEFDALDFTTKSSKGTPLIDVDAHVRLASHEKLNGIEILRRGYNFTDGTDGFGQLDAGLFFIVLPARPPDAVRADAVELARNDALNEYITHTGSAVFACPPGLREGDASAYWGSTLLS